MLIVNSFLERTIGWETGCDVYALLGAISGMGQAITNAAIAFDRYRSACAIMFPQFLLLIIEQFVVLFITEQSRRRLRAR